MQGHCVDQDTLREYCWYNNRIWNDAHWEKAHQTAIYSLASDAAYIKASNPQKRAMENMQACTQFYRLMNLVAYYNFVPNVTEDTGFRTFNPESVAGSLRPVGDDALPNDTDLLYSAKWNGTYTRREIEWLDAKYENYMSQHNLDTEHLQDAAKKQCTLALLTDDVAQRYRRGEATLDEYQKVMKMYDDAAKSNMFAACKRKPGDAEGGTSFSEISQRLQATGKIEAVRVSWPKDVVDIVLEEYYGMASKMGQDGVFT